MTGRLSGLEPFVPPHPADQCDRLPTSVPHSGLPAASPPAAGPPTTLSARPFARPTQRCPATTQTHTRTPI